MKKIIASIFILTIAVASYAVPAKRGWSTYTQPDGTTIEIQTIGDEFYHYTINREGHEVRLNTNGFYEAVGLAPQSQQAQARRAAAKQRRQPAAFGTTPNLAPKGVVILANFADAQMNDANTLAVFDELCNSTNCTVNKYKNINYPSAAQYFADQSNGTYRPQFDVYGPVTLPKKYAYYGNNDAVGNDKYAADAVVEACKLANDQYPQLNFADYDTDQDGKIDFVYIIYAGMGEADGGAANTIWPHNWDIYSAYYFKNCTYPQAEWKVDGKTINTYAMSAELEGAGTLGGIGTLCHEFSHVMGLADLYDTDYGTNSENFLTPNEWDIMDQGSYNGDGHCPPNYNVWAKYFFGWVNPVNLQQTPQNITLIANGETNYNAYYLTSHGADMTATTGGWCYYLENRQQKGWDKFLPAHGMVIWQVNYNKTAWANNVPNNTSTTDSPLFTIICSSGKYIGNNNGKGNVFGGSSSVTSWKGFPEQPLLNIKETNGIITATYIAEPIIVTWMVDGEVIETKEYASDGSQDLVLPTATVTPCEATTFVGWTTETNWADPFILPTDLFTTPSGKATKSITYYALFK